MMTGNDIGKLIADACEVTQGYSGVRHGGNLGMAIIAAAIADHASAVRELAKALEKRKSDGPLVGDDV